MMICIVSAPTLCLAVSGGVAVEPSGVAADMTLQCKGVARALFPQKYRGNAGLTRIPLRDIYSRRPASGS